MTHKQKRRFDFVDKRRKAATAILGKALAEGRELSKKERLVFDNHMRQILRRYSDA